MKWILLGLFTVSIHASDVLAAVLICEAGGEKDPRAMAAIWEVINNRAIERNRTPFEIATQPYQFSSLNNGINKAVEKAKQHPKWQLALQITSVSPQTNFTYGSDHYYEDSIRPKWARKMKVMVKIGKHTFLKGK